MKIKLLFAFTILSLFPVLTNADIIYRVEQTEIPKIQSSNGIDSQSLSRLKRFYVGGYYNYSMWQSYTDDIGTYTDGNDTSSYEVVAGIRLYDTFRVEANYARTQAQWNTLSISGDTFTMNAILDGRIGNLYRILYQQTFVPYIGIGAGASWNSGKNGINLTNKVSPVISAMAGFSIEFNKIFALDIGYKYIHMFDGKNNIIPELSPTAHQIRAGARIHF